MGQAHHPRVGAHRHGVVAAKKTGRLRVREAVASVLEDAVRSQQTQNAVEGVGVGAAPRCQLRDAKRFVLEYVGHSELGDEVEALRWDKGVRQRPDDFVRLLFDHVMLLP